MRLNIVVFPAPLPAMHGVPGVCFSNITHQWWPQLKQHIQIIGLTVILHCLRTIPLVTVAAKVAVQFTVRLPGETNSNHRPSVYLAKICL